MLSGYPRFWRGDQAVALQAVEAQDEPGECQRLAVRVADTYGFAVVNGWAIAREHGPVWHFWNLTPAGEVVDGARSRRVALGYYGKVLDPVELDRLRASSELPTGRELLEHAVERVALAGRFLNSLLGE